MARNYFVTGGAGFIGSNYVHRLVERGEQVTIFDNLSRGGAPRNIAWLQETFGNDAFKLIVGDLRDADLIQESAKDADVIVHLAGQVAVTTSVNNPRDDFEANALGTFNALEAARLSDRNPVFIYSSTNKVYGGMEDVEIIEDATRWLYKDLEYGCSEAQPLDFHSPYGVSKGAGDQYTRDYSRIYGLRSVVFRQSCIYGPRQFGVEDQGWLAWMMIAAVTGKQITVYGDGKQVRDVLHVNDLLNAYDLAVEKIDDVKGEVYNVGGGTRNVMAIWAEFGPILERLIGRKIEVARDDWRPGDQRVFYADFRKAQRELGWEPKIDLEEGMELLFDWINHNRELF
ncbi:MAG TPA: GDP-mannose 4,6-dehydratase [Anaerolineales bacterium]|nr:GDP-mannose 4,6-dehydratase [Anaerolineales bacterium]